MAKAQDLLLELGCEELPAKSSPRIAQWLEDSIKQQLDAATLAYDSLAVYYTPRRLACIVSKLSTEQPAQTHKRQGPAQQAALDANGNPSAAAQGFAKSCGVSIEDLAVENGRLTFTQHTPGQKTIDLLPELLARALDQLPGIKTMRWDQSPQGFPRPVRWVVLLYGSQKVHCELFGCQASNQTYGHRFLSPKAIKLKNASQYLTKLESPGMVIADQAQRRATIVKALKAQKLRHGQVCLDDTLLDEVTQLVEWPVVLRGQYEEKFLSLPRELITSVLHGHQKCFPCVSKDSPEQLIPYFMVVSNLNSKDPERVVNGNERVVRARLSDALFFLQNDQKRRLEDHLPQLDRIVFQKDLGSIGDKVRRIKKLATSMAKGLGADSKLTQRAADLCKADLCTDTVGEFPELEGLMGYHLACHQRERITVARAIRDYAMPRQMGDLLPKEPVACALAIADKLDTLCGLFAIGQPPTGTKDPFALRRAALGLVRILIERALPLDLASLIPVALRNIPKAVVKNPQTRQDVQQFILDRLKAFYQEQGISPDVFAAVQACKLSVLTDIDQRIKALQAFMLHPDAATLIAANKRVSKLLQKNPIKQNVTIDSKLLQEPAEKALANALAQSQKQVTPLMNKANYTKALLSLVKLATPIDDFFEHVMVMTDDPKIRQNRLALLQQLREQFHQIADISLL